MSASDLDEKSLALLEELQKLVGKDAILNIYNYGSYNYGTWHAKSDRDYILVVDMRDSTRDYNSESIDLMMYSPSEFKKRLIEDHAIELIEAIHKPVFEKVKFEFKLDLQKLRHSISFKSDHCYVKAKKKLTVPKDRDVYMAKKSLFHGFRILDYATQVCKDGKIINWDVHELYDEIMKLPEDADKWPEWETQFKKRFNKKKSDFRALAPK